MTSPLTAERVEIVWPEPYEPVSARKLRFAKWFLAAGWSMLHVAHLFDVYPHELQAAIDRDERAPA